MTSIDIVEQPLGLHNPRDAQRMHQKRMHADEEFKGGNAAGHKKNRAAFGDLTNSAQPSQENQPAAAATAPAHLACSDVTNTVLITPSSEFRRRLCVTDGVSPASEANPTPARRYVDIDSTEDGNPLGCRGYAALYYDGLRTKEKQRRPSVTYMEMVQNDVNPGMRSILVDWLIEVAQEYKLSADTLYRTVDYVDRFLSKVPVIRSELQLVGVACMQIASKVEEVYAPTVQDFVYITDSSYSADQLLDMEAKVLQTLCYVAGVHSHLFLDRFLRAAAAECVPDQRLVGLTSYLLELALEDYHMLNFLPSEITASAVLLALYLLSVHPCWSETLTHYTTYTPTDLRAPVCSLYKLLLRRQSSSEFPAVSEKYSRVLNEAAPSLRKQLRAGNDLPEWLFQDFA